MSTQTVTMKKCYNNNNNSKEANEISDINFVRVLEAMKWKFIESFFFKRFPVEKAANFNTLLFLNVTYSKILLENMPYSQNHNLFVIVFFSRFPFSCFLMLLLFLYQEYIMIMETIKYGMRWSLIFIEVIIMQILREIYLSHEFYFVGNIQYIENLSLLYAVVSSDRWMIICFTVHSCDLFKFK